MTTEKGPNTPPTELEEIPEDDLLRDVAVGDYRLRTWDTQKSDHLGKWIVGYEFVGPAGVVLFKGQDFSCSPLHAIDSEECLRGILSFLTLRRGDTDADYFDTYTAEQLAFAEGDAAELALFADREFAAEYPLRDWQPEDNTGVGELGEASTSIGKSMRNDINGVIENSSTVKSLI